MHLDGEIIQLERQEKGRGSAKLCLGAGTPKSAWPKQRRPRAPLTERVPPPQYLDIQCPIYAGDVDTVWLSISHRIGAEREDVRRGAQLITQLQDACKGSINRYKGAVGATAPHLKLLVMCSRGRGKQKSAHSQITCL